MVFEGRVAEMLQNQASRFLRGFTSDQLKLGLVTGRLELRNLALNPEPFDALLLESEVPLIMKAGFLTSAVAQLSLLQGELELTIDGLLLVLGPACRWLTRAEVFTHRVNEIQRLEFVHMRSQCQRRTLEREMFRQLFSDYLSRLKITIRNVHLRIEIEGELSPCGAGPDGVFGMVMGLCEITPVKSAVVTSDKDKEGSIELLLAERLDTKGFSLYHEMSTNARMLVSWDVYHSTRNDALGVFEKIKQDQFVQLMHASQRQHASVPVSEQLMPLTSFSASIELSSQPVRDGFTVDSCLTMEITVHLEAPSRLRFSLHTLKHLQWFITRTLDFQIWQFLHPVNDRPDKASKWWHTLRTFVALKRRIHSNVYILREAIAMRIHCKEYVKLYKKKFNGPTSIVVWRKSMPPLTNGDAVRLSDIELIYPADKVVNFRLMAHAELKTEMALNSFLNSEDVADSGDRFGGSNPYRRVARELTHLEQLHLHGQHGYGVNIYRGLPPPPSSLKIRIDVQAPKGLWWVCSLSGGSPPTASRGNSIDSNSWAVALDCAAQPIRLLLVDSLTDASVFATVEVPAAPQGQRPISLLLGRTASAFAAGSPGRNQSGGFVTSGGSALQEWCSVFELHGTVHCCSQLKTVLTSSPNSPWDIFLHVSCGEVVDSNSPQAATGFSRMQPIAAVASDANRNSRICLRVPLVMPSGQPGPLTEMLGQFIASTRSPQGGMTRCGPSHSFISWVARHISVTYNIAIFRIHARLPPLLIDSGHPTSEPVRLPRFDGACHLEHGGLVDGFVIGLHNLRNFVVSLASAGHSERERGEKGGVNHHRSSGSIPWSLLPLQHAPPVALLLSAMLTAVAVVLCSHIQAARGQRTAPTAPQLANALSDLLTRHKLVRIFNGGKQSTSSDQDSPASAVTLCMVLLMVLISRRTLWDHRDSKLNSQTAPSSGEGTDLRGSVAKLQGLFASVFHSLLVMGFPLHPRCLPIAAWAGAVEVLEAASSAMPAGVSWPPPGLLIWAGRGTFVNLQTRQDEVVKWLLCQKARIDEIDKTGKSFLDWACWGGNEEMVSLALRSGLLPSITSRVNGPAQDSPSAMPVPTAPSPLSLAVASRNARVVSMLLRAAGDPHAPIRGGSAGPLLLAVRNCEYEIGCTLLRDAPYVAVDAALGANFQTVGTKGDFAENMSSAGCNVRATIAIVESLRRFAGSLSRRSAEDLGHSGIRVHSPGPHPDEGLYSTGQLPFSDILHPLMVQLPLPIHKVGHELRPQHPPHRWLRRNTPTPWAAAQLFVECCIHKSFRPDPAVISRLSPDARKLMQHLFGPELASLPASDPPTSPLTTPSLDVNAENGATGWFGAVLSPDDRRISASPNRRKNGEEELSAAISFAKEIRQLRARPHASEDVPPIDIASALGAAVPPLTAKDSSGKRRRDSRRLQAPPGEPTVWLAVSLGGTIPAVGPLPVDSIFLESTQISWNLRNVVSSDGGSTSTVSMPLKELGALRAFEQSNYDGTGTSGTRHVAEIRVENDGDATGLVERLMLASGKSDKGALIRSNGYTNGTQTRHTACVIFARHEDVDQFVGAFNTHRQMLEVSSHDSIDNGQLKASNAEVDSYLKGGPWDTEELRNSMAQQKAEQAAKSSVTLPAIRVVIVGPPRVGKSRVAQSLAADLNLSEPRNASTREGDGPAWLRMVSGTWPKSGKPRAEVHVWDGASAPLPGLLERLVADPAVPLLLVPVVDAALSGSGAPGDAVIAACSREVTVSSSAPRRALVVENVFANQSQQPQSHVAREKSSNARLNYVRCNVRAADELCELLKALTSALGSLAGELENRTPSSSSSSQKGCSMPVPPGSKSEWSTVVTPRRSWQPGSSRTAGSSWDPALASRLGGDATLLDPSVVAWAWGAVRAAHGSLAEGCNPSSGCGAALVPWDRLERVLAAIDPRNGFSAAPLLLRALADLGLVCPIPAPRGEGGAQLGCNWVLLPDFARRVRLASATAAKLPGDSSTSCGANSARPPGPTNNGSTPSGGNDAGVNPDGGNAAPTPVSARLVWDNPDAPPPPLRTVLRDFLARGALGSPGRAGTARFLEVRRFVLLEAGPTGSPGATTIDGLFPGFLLGFDLAQAPMPDRDKVDGETAVGMTCAKPPTSVRTSTPSGATSHKSNGTTIHTADDDMAMNSTGNATRLTALIVGVSGDTSSRGQKTDGSAGAPFWDVHCSGPHAQWALRALLGSGAVGPSFTGFRRGNEDANGGSRLVPSPAGSAWLLPVPACVVSTSTSSTQSVGGTCFDQPTGIEFVGLSWLFNGPRAAQARAALLPKAAPPISGFAACCAALCGRDSVRAATAGLEEDCGMEGLVSCADFEASLLARNWRAAPRCLDGALGAGAEAWALCAAALARIAHDAAGAAAGAHGRALPLLQSVSSKAVALIPDGPQPLIVGPGCVTTKCLGALRANAGVQAWLRLCKPAALWAAAGGARGFVDLANETKPTTSTAACAGEQVVDALSAALSVQFTEEMVAEVWDALSELDTQPLLIRRAGGTWAQVRSDATGFVL